MSYDVVWEQPPPAAPGRARIDWPSHLEPLTTHPGRWARIASFRGETSAYKVAQRLRADPRFSSDNWEFAARRHRDGGSRLFARYTGRPKPTRKRQPRSRSRG